jgi:hypothetical protein
VKKAREYGRRKNNSGIDSETLSPIWSGLEFVSALKA